MEEILRLFKSYLGEKSNSVNEKALKYGLLIPSTASQEVVDSAIEQYGKDGVKWNATFHKDFEIVKNAPIEDLVTQQIIHYITTYGFESLGFFDNDLVYIPKETLEIPELDIDKIELTPIKPITAQELTDKLMVLLTSGIALSKQTIKDIMTLSDYIDKERFDEIANREIKIALYDKYNIMPRNPEEFLRFVIFKTTGETLKIQSKELINLIKNSDNTHALDMFKSYLKSPKGLEKLGSIFLRNKNLFLAFKVSKDAYRNAGIRKEFNAIINKIRKAAVLNHKPLETNILDVLTSADITDDYIDNSLAEALDNITIFREIRMLNGVSYRLYGDNNIIYRIRNGKSYVATLPEKTSDYVARLEKIYYKIYTHLIGRIKEKVAGKTICIPENVVYAAPTSEKRFNGNFPEGSYFITPRNADIVYGVHWTNIANGIEEESFYGSQTKKGEERVDLDLKQMNKSAIFGWDASYRSESGKVLFSGDLTNAEIPTGATELFYIDRNYDHGAFLITLNMFTSNSQDVPFEFVIANSEHIINERVNHVIDPNNIIEKINMVVKNTEREKVVGFITIGENIKFYFDDFSIGASRCTSRQDDITMGAFDYIQAYSKIQLKLNDLLRYAGATITNEPVIVETETSIDEVSGEEIITTKETPVDIDLSINAITKETIVGLLS